MPKSPTTPGGLSLDIGFRLTGSTAKNGPHIAIKIITNKIVDPQKTFLFLMTNCKTDNSDSFSKEENCVSLLINILSSGRILYTSDQLSGLAKHISD